MFPNALATLHAENKIGFYKRLHTRRARTFQSLSQSIFAMEIPTLENAAAGFLLCLCLHLGVLAVDLPYEVVKNLQSQL